MKFFTPEEKAEYRRLVSLSKTETLTERQSRAMDAYKTVTANYVTVFRACLVFGAMSVISLLKDSGALAFMAVVFCVFACFKSIRTANIYYDYWADYFEQMSRE